jgi:hypothetical protein
MRKNRDDTSRVLCPNTRPENREERLVTPFPSHGCVEKCVFASNKPWRLQIAKGDFCLLHRYDVVALFVLWCAQTNGGRNLAPKAWGGKFPFQVKVALVSQKIIGVPKSILPNSKLTQRRVGTKKRLRQNLGQDDSGVANRERALRIN